MVYIEYGIEIDSEDEDEDCLEDENTTITQWIMHQVVMKSLSIHHRGNKSL